MERKKTGFDDPVLNELLESLHKSIRENPNWKKEGSVELIKRLRRETAIRQDV